MTDPVPLARDDGVVSAFLAGSPAAGWAREPLAGDASSRRYERLRSPDGERAILMDARAEPASIAPFLRIAAHLQHLGLGAPTVLAQGEGLLLLEDLGPTTMAAWLAERPRDAHDLYAAAVGVLATVQAAPPPKGLVALSPGHAAGMIAPLFEHHVPGTHPDLAVTLTATLHDALERLAPDAKVLALRDYHTENLIWRPEQTDLGRVGLLDFQDAVLAPPEYDLASLLRDARRDTDPGLRAAMTSLFARLTGRDEAHVAAAAAALGVQRNLRILGIFSRLAHERGRTAYLDLLPRVRAHLDDDLRHPALGEVTKAARAVLPPIQEPS